MLATHGPQFLEACPECGTRDITPKRTERPDTHTVVGHYVCACGSHWTTSWWEADQ